MALQINREDMAEGLLTAASEFLDAPIERFSPESRNSAKKDCEVFAEVIEKAQEILEMDWLRRWSDQNLGRLFFHARHAVTDQKIPTVLSQIPGWMHLLDLIDGMGSAYVEQYGDDEELWYWSDLSRKRDDEEEQKYR